MGPTSSILVDVQHISLQQGGRKILEDVHFSLASGQILSIVGPNGAGKTTLIRVMLGLVPPTGGRVIRSPGLTVGYVPQRLHFDPYFPMSVERFLQLGQPHPSTVHAIAKEVGIETILTASMRSLSGGEWQRALLARALLRRPALLVLDEPAQGVDLMGQGELYDLILRIRDRYACGILLVSHDLNIVMAQTDTVVCLNRHICCQGHPAQVSQDPAFVALFGDVASHLALYAHRHDHHHSHGDSRDKKGPSA